MLDSRIESKLTIDGLEKQLSRVKKQRNWSIVLNILLLAGIVALSVVYFSEVENAGSLIARKSLLEERLTLA